MPFSRFLVYFEWDDSLDGRIGYMANTAADLRECMDDLPSADYSRGVSIGRVHHSSKRGHPFRLGDTGMTFRFFYPCTFDTYWDAYQVGTTILYRTEGSDWKVIPPGTIITDRSYWSNVYCYEICHESLDDSVEGYVVDSSVGSSYVSFDDSSDDSITVTTSDVSTNCTWGRLAKWLASGYGLVRLPDKTVSLTVSFPFADIDEPVSPGVHILPFEGLVWVEPLVRIINDYLGEA